MSNKTNIEELTKKYNLQPETNLDVIEWMKEYWAIVNQAEKK